MGPASSGLKYGMLHRFEVDQHRPLAECRRHVEMVAITTKSTVAVSVNVSEHVVAVKQTPQRAASDLMGPTSWIQDSVGW